MWSHDEKLRQICEMRNGNEACLTTTSMKSGHRSKVKVVLALVGSHLERCVVHNVALMTGTFFDLLDKLKGIPFRY